MRGVDNLSGARIWTHAGPFCSDVQALARRLTQVSSIAGERAPQAPSSRVTAVDDLAGERICNSADKIRVEFQECFAGVVQLLRGRRPAPEPALTSPRAQRFCLEDVDCCFLQQPGYQKQSSIEARFEALDFVIRGQAMKSGPQMFALDLEDDAGADDSETEAGSDPRASDSERSSLSAQSTFAAR